MSYPYAKVYISDDRSYVQFYVDNNAMKRCVSVKMNAKDIWRVLVEHGVKEVHDISFNTLNIWRKEYQDAEDVRDELIRALGVENKILYLQGKTLDKYNPSDVLQDVISDDEIGKVIANKIVERISKDERKEKFVRGIKMLFYYALMTFIYSFIPVICFLFYFVL